MSTLTIDGYTLEVNPMRFLDVQTYSKELRRRSNKLEMLSTLEKRYNRDLSTDGNIEEISAKLEELESERDEAETVLFNKMLEIAKSGIVTIKKGDEMVDKDVVNEFTVAQIGEINDVVLGNITKKN